MCAACQLIPFHAALETTVPTIQAFVLQSPVELLELFLRHIYSSIAIADASY